LRIALDFDPLEPTEIPPFTPWPSRTTARAVRCANPRNSGGNAGDFQGKTLLLGRMRNASAGPKATPEFAVAFEAAHLPCAICWQGNPWALAEDHSVVGNGVQIPWGTRENLGSRF